MFLLCGGRDTSGAVYDILSHGYIKQSIDSIDNEYFLHVHRCGLLCFTLFCLDLGICLNFNSELGCGIVICLNLLMDMKDVKKSRQLN